MKVYLCCSPLTVAWGGSPEDLECLFSSFATSVETTASSTLRSGEVMLGEPTAQSALETHNASFKSVGNGFRIGGGVRDSIDVRGTTLNSNSNIYLSDGTVKLFNASTGNFNLDITNAAANSIGITTSLNAKMQTGDQVRITVLVGTTKSNSITIP